MIVKIVEGNILIPNLLVISIGANVGKLVIFQLGKSHTWKGFFYSIMGLMTNDQINQPILPVETDRKQLFNLLYGKDWVVYAKAPFGGPQAVIEYLGRYTHKVAISNHRIQSINKESDTVTFTYKDYSDDGTQKQMTLTSGEFIRRFTQHILPERFTKKRTHGYLANRGRHGRIKEVLKKMKLPLHKGLVKIPIEVRMLEQYGIDMKECPACKNRTLHLIRIFYFWKQADDG